MANGKTHWGVIPRKLLHPQRRQWYAAFGTGMLCGFFLSSTLFMALSTTQTTTIAPMNNDESILTAAATAGSGCLDFFHRYQTGHSQMNAGSSSSSSSLSSGWKSIHVFYGNTSHLSSVTEVPADYLAANRWFSQSRQDEIVSRLLNNKRNGYFIDLAANDPVRLSNSYALETHFDWTGLCLEPNPIYWGGLAYRKCHVIAAVMGGDTKMQEVSFRFPRAKGPKGGILGQAYDNKQDTWKEGRPRFTVTLEEVFEQFEVPTVIDYFSLDIEGAEEWVMTTFPFDQYRFNVMTVERPSDVLSKLLTTNGYVLLKTIKAQTDDLWVHNSILSTLDKSALNINSEEYRYRDNTGLERVAPDDHKARAHEK